MVLPGRILQDDGLIRSACHKQVVAGDDRGPDPKVTDDEIIRQIMLIPFPVATAGELTDRLPITRDAVNKRLRRMEERGLVRSKQVGSSAKVWVETDAGQQLASQEE
jgi:DNA-binding transcriptional ArsR family regulator